MPARALAKWLDEYVPTSSYRNVKGNPNSVFNRSHVNRNALTSSSVSKSSTPRRTERIEREERPLGTTPVAVLFKAPS
jgi:hypothetical protein